VGLIISMPKSKLRFCGVARRRWPNRKSWNPGKERRIEFARVFMKFVIKRPKEVESDLLAAARWYDVQQPGLGDDFLDECEAAIASLSANALLYSVRFADVRCIRLPRFKRYGVYYFMTEEQIVLLAVHHGARDSRWLEERRKRT